MTKGSGSGKFEKGDVRISGVTRIEAKTTKHRSFSVTLEMIDKIETASLSAGEVPAIVVEFLNQRGAPVTDVAVIPMWALELLIDKQGK